MLLFNTTVKLSAHEHGRDSTVTSAKNHLEKKATESSKREKGILSDATGDITHKIKKLLVSVTEHTLELIDYSTLIPTQKKRIKLSNYKYDFEQGEDWATSQKNKNTENGVRRISVTNDFIYLLYDPNKDNYRKLNTEIWIFDWEGNPQKKIIPNHFIETFCIDINDNYLYAICNLTDYTLFRINLKH